MPFNGSGVFNRIMNWVNDAANSIPITASRTDTDTNDIASGLTNCMTRDGQSPATANIPMGTFRLLNCGDAVLNNEYVTKGQGATLFQAPLGYTPVNKAGDTMTGALSVTGGVTASTSVSATGGTFTGAPTNIVLQPSTAGGQVILRPNGGSTSNQMVANSTGILNIPVGVEVTQFGYIRSSGANLLLAAAGGGAVGIRPLGTANNSVELTVNASNTASFTGTFSANIVTQTSDARLKENIASIEPRDLSDIPYDSWNFIESGSYGQGHVAQNVEAVAPEYVHEVEGVKTVDQAGLALEKLAYIEGLLKRRGIWS